MVQASDDPTVKPGLPGFVQGVVYERDDGMVYLSREAIFETLLKGPTIDLVSEKGTYKVSRILLEPFCKKVPAEDSVKVSDSVAVFVSNLFSGKEVSAGANDSEAKLAGDMSRADLNLTGSPQGPAIPGNPRRVFFRFSRPWLRDNFRCMIVEKDPEAEEGAEAPAEPQEDKPPPALPEGSKAHEELAAVLNHDKVPTQNLEELGQLSDWYDVDWAISWPLVAGWKALVAPNALEMELLLASLRREAGVDNARVAATRLALSDTYREGKFEFFFDCVMHFSVNRMMMRGIMTRAMVILCQENEEINKLMLKAAKDGWPMWVEFSRGMDVDPETGKVAICEDEDCDLLRALEVDDADALIAWIVSSKGGDFNCKVAPGTRVSEIFIWSLDDDCRTLTVLCAAAAFGCANCVRVLLGNGATADQPSLKAALYSGSEDCIRLLQSRVQMTDVEPLQLALTAARGWNCEGLEMVLNEYCASFALDDYEELRVQCYNARTRVCAAEVIAWSRYALEQAEQYAAEKVAEAGKDKEKSKAG